MKEQRTAHRYELSLPVLIHVGASKQDALPNAKTRDISTSGMYFTIDRDLEVDAELDMTLKLPIEVGRGSEVLIRAIGKIVRIEKKLKEGSPYVGVGAVIMHYEFIRNEPPTL